MGLDYIDTYVFVEALVEEEDHCTRYLNKVGYKDNNTALVSPFVFCEFDMNLFFDFDPKDRDYERTSNKIWQEEKSAYYGAFHELLVEYEQEEKAEILNLRELDLAIHTFQELLNEYEKDGGRGLTYDDALHLTVAIQNDCDRFITGDSFLTKEWFRGEIQSEYGVEITEEPLRV